jgi:hypothetical protein
MRPGSNFTLVDINDRSAFPGGTLIVVTRDGQPAYVGDPKLTLETGRPILTLDLAANQEQDDFTDAVISLLIEHGGVAAIALRKDGQIVSVLSRQDAAREFAARAALLGMGVESLAGPITTSPPLYRCPVAGCPYSALAFDSDPLYCVVHPGTRLVHP